MLQVECHSMVIQSTTIIIKIVVIMVGKVERVTSYLTTSLLLIFSNGLGSLDLWRERKYIDF